MPQKTKDMAEEFHCHSKLILYFQIFCKHNSVEHVCIQYFFSIHVLTSRVQYELKFARKYITEFPVQGTTTALFNVI